ncbi:FtsW/RodA/SpoVE family cell cycle protein [Ruminococcus sp. YE282]|uniref:FtsW/RodA/SpoVE family cell cycle protein n=1 Tax=Ruminococcus sp. YE282 TaxID=3158780 RepID=UPI00089133FE|nr:FtsW/RodA/SpoVE family cell cycle protein [Ruminococcus bromii]MEE3498540.1 FtsW/RodA/SpoVE family cell cycle protein [Ruminococcus bromii]SCY61605.1 cell division protein FtsW, lipid II flippase [Ruminococcus bromii]
MFFSAIFDIGVVALRILLPVYAIIIVYQCYAAMRRRRRPETPLVTLVNPQTGLKLPVLFWENSIGRSRSSDIVVDDPTVSRSHCVLLRRSDGWFITDTGSKSGTYVNGEKIEERTQLLIDDVIGVGNSEFEFKRGEEYHERLDSSWFFRKVNNKPAIKSWKLMLMITLFHFFMCVEAMFWNDATNPFSPLVLFAALAGVEWAFFFVSSYILRRVNFELEALALFLTGTGVMLLVRQVERSAYVQLIAAAVGMILFCVIIKFIQNPDKVNKLRFPMMIVAVGLLLTSVIFGKTTGGAANWIYIGSISIQPSELVKVIYIFIGSSALDKLQTKKNLLEFIVFSIVCVGLLALMGDFGTALIFFMTFLLIAFMRSGDFKTIILAVAAAVFGATIILRFKPYVANRFKAWRHVWDYAQDQGYQQVHVLTFIASGGLFGVGIGNGFLKQVAASESDLVFGLVSEEMGIIVAITLALAVALLVVYARAITTRSRSTFYSISACCAAGLLVVQLALNIFGATDILPLTGVTFPFISSGGSSIISCWGLLAFVKAADERTYSMKR